MITMLRAAIDEVNRTQECDGYPKRGTDKNTVVEIKNGFDKLISNLDHALGRISQVVGHISRSCKTKKAKKTSNDRAEQNIQGLRNNRHRCNCTY
jgi:hypothetical protein